MKKTMLFFVGLSLALVSHAQINITQSTYTSSPIGTDSLKVTTKASPFPSLVAATNATWDLSTVTDSAANLFTYMVSATTPATFADSAFYSLGTYAYQGNIQSAITASGLVEYGINVQSATYTISAGDTIFISAQNDVFSSNYTVIRFPATMSSSWSSTYESDINFFISYAPALFHAPGILKSYFTEKDSVIGWGKMRIKTAAGTPSGYMDVLQVRTNVTRTDSFSLNGSTSNPLLGSLLPVLGVTQGQVTNTFAQNYYRLDDVLPLAYVQFTSGNYDTAYKATTHVQRLATSGVPNVSNEAVVKVYPNPVTGQMVNLELPALSGAWSYEIMDLNGRNLQRGALQPHGSAAQVTLPSSMSAGVYYIKINNDGNQVCMKSIELVK